MASNIDKRTVGVVTAGIIAIAIVISIVSCGISASSHNTSSSNTSNSDSANRPVAGQNAFVKDLPGDYIADSKNDFMQLTNFETQNNQSAITDMMNSGQVAVLPQGTKVEVLDIGWSGIAHIKIMSGAGQGQEVYTDDSFLSTVGN